MLAQIWWIAVLVGGTAWFMRRRRDVVLPGLIISAVIVPVALSLLVLQTLPRYHEYVVPLVAGVAAMFVWSTSRPNPSTTMEAESVVRHHGRSDSNLSKSMPWLVWRPVDPG
jgi:hypothetical protein